MKASRFSDRRKALIPRQGADAVLVEDICRKAGINQATYFQLEKEVLGHAGAGYAPAEAARG